jgi:hypothetical protein
LTKAIEVVNDKHEKILKETSGGKPRNTGKGLEKVKGEPQKGKSVFEPGKSPIQITATPKCSASILTDLGLYTE